MWRHYGALSTKTKNCAVTGFLLLLSITLLLPVQAKDGGKKRKKDSEKSELPAVMWQEPKDIATRDLFYGSGSKDKLPKPPFKFVKEDPNETQPKFDVEDANGQRWRVKVGIEAQSETAATRIVWAAGYFTDEDCYFPEIKVEGIPKLKRGQKYVSADGTVHGVRMEWRPKGVKTLDNWNWFDNPFVGTREFNGLRVLMALINNWDLLPGNSKIYDENGKRVFVVSDLGESFGNGPQYFSRWCNDPSKYAHSKFIKHTAATSIDVAIHSHEPLYNLVYSPIAFFQYIHAEHVGDDIPRTDAKWMGELLSKLSDSQLRDAFRAGGYNEVQTDLMLRELKSRIQLLTSL